MYVLHVFLLPIIFQLTDASFANEKKNEISFAEVVVGRGFNSKQRSPIQTSNQQRNTPEI